MPERKEALASPAGASLLHTYVLTPPTPAARAPPRFGVSWHGLCCRLSAFCKVAARRSCYNGAVVLVRSRTEAPMTPNYCPNCGRTNSPGRSFCEHCFYQFGGPEQPKGAGDQLSALGCAIWKFTWSIAALLFICFVVYACWQR